ncbi:MAG: flagellar hook-associated protein FlgK [Acidovorax sp. SCN 68-22]|jgi:flagellar hook-associated protein 1 FlgK|nr:flagellar hook-associated protein FlgK [Simplicispira sp.]ODS70983.1 MAG: flagellar hook-associated protein FlgK [Acidovorax sp. SCN 68-22]
MSLLNVGSRALLANQVALQTAGHNIANVNTAGYSRQTVVLQTVPGQFTGGGYIGKGVDVQTILRNHSDLLTRQAAAAASVDASDSARVARLKQLQDVFSGGASGLGAAINDMMNSLSDVVNSPTDMTARSIALTRMDETGKRMIGASERLDDISNTVSEQLKGNVQTINQLAQNIAQVNEQIARAKGNGQPPNDLLDQRDQLVRDLSQRIQVSQVAADDGTLSLFVAGSQPLVLGNKAGTLSIEDPKDFGAASGQQRLLFQQPGATTKQELSEAALGGGEVAGLLRFQNSDLQEGYHLLNRMATAISLSLNAQNQLGLTLDGQMGKALFADVPPLQPKAASTNTSAATMAVAFSDPGKLAAASHVVVFTGATTGTVTAQPGGQPEAFGGAGQPTLAQYFAAHGLQVGLSGPPNAGDQFLVNPMKDAAARMQAQQFSPSQLAAASPVNAQMGAANAGSLQLASLKATGQPGGAAFVPPPSPVLPATTGGGVTLSFTAGPPATFTVAGNATPLMDVSVDPPVPLAGPPYAYNAGQAITIDGWSITLGGAPKTGDTVTVGNALDAQYGDWYQRNAGNASALMALRDARMFDGATLSDGFAGAMAQIGSRTQSAQFAQELSASFAANLERDRTAVSGVNLDEEAARLIQYQQAYQASAKMIQIAQNVFDTLITSMGR